MSHSPGTCNCFLCSGISTSVQWALVNQGAAASNNKSHPPQQSSSKPGYFERFKCWFIGDAHKRRHIEFFLIRFALIGWTLIFTFLLYDRMFGPSYKDHVDFIVDRYNKTNIAGVPFVVEHAIDHFAKESGWSENEGFNSWFNSNGDKTFEAYRQMYEAHNMGHPRIIRN